MSIKNKSRTLGEISNYDPGTDNNASEKCKDRTTIDRTYIPGNKNIVIDNSDISCDHWQKQDTNCDMELRYLCFP